VKRVLLLALLSCGPSFQAIYEGDARFEHCYAMDDNPNASLHEKGDCWKDWYQHYTYGQTRDRVEYAVARARALSRAPQVPTDEAMMAAAPGEVPAGRSVAAPAPTSAFAPPPKTLAEMDGGAPSSSSLPPPRRDTRHATPATSAALPTGPSLPPPPPPESECVGVCRQTWESCASACADGAGTKTGAAPACPECEKAYVKCAKKCFK
jgi:hypothetical protein